MALTYGEMIPTFRTPGVSNANYAFDTAAGRYLMLGVFSRADEADIAQGAALAERFQDRFNDALASCYVLLPETETWRKDRADAIGLRWLFDAGNKVSDLLGVTEGALWFLVDPMLRVFGIASPEHAEQLFEQVAKLPPVDVHAGVPVFAPVLTVPRVFEPGFCDALIKHYEAEGGEASGFMQEVGGITKLVMDERHKMRSDVHLPDGELKNQARARILRRLVPQIYKAYQFQCTRMERYLVACYDAETGGYFRPHRDNTTKGTAHRRFAVSINLNADFDGGDLRFPEFGQRTYRPPPGGAVVFSCSLLHEATPVTRGKRYAFLPFLYDDAAALIREENIGFLDPALGGYTAGRRPEPQEAG